MNVDELMTSNPFTVGSSCRVRDARALAIFHGIRHLPVVDSDYLVGVVCLCDLERASDASPVASVMSRRLLTVEPDTAVEDAAFVMRARRVGCLPVVAGDRLVGILSRGDLMRAPPISGFVVGDRVCTCCRSHHELVPSSSGAAPFFCRECLEHSRTDDLSDPAELGCGD